MAVEPWRFTVSAMMRRRAWIASALAFSAGCNVNRFFLTKAVEGQADFFADASSDTGLTPLSPRVFTFGHRSDRGIAVITERGLVVSDTFNEDYVTELLSALRAAGVDAPVHAAVLSHGHFDHIGGLERLGATEVLGRPSTLARVSGPASAARPIGGGESLSIGGVRFEVIDTAPAHDHALIALDLPEDGVLYAPDVITPHAFQLGWTPDVPLGGYMATVERLGAMAFDTFVASHLGFCDRAGFDDTVAMQRDVVETAHAQFDAAGIRGSNLHYDRERAGEAFEAFYDALRPRYGTWHGFEQNVLPIFVRLYTDALLGLSD